MVSLIAYCSKRIKPEAKIIVDIKIYYPDVYEDLNLAKFSILIYAFKASNEDYRGNTAEEYYYMLRIDT